MTRTSQRKLFQIALLFAIIVIAHFLFARDSAQPSSRLVRLGSIWLVIFLIWIPYFTMRKLFKAQAFEVYSNQPLASAYICLGSAQRALGSWNAAAESYGRAIEIDPLCPTAYLGMAALAAELGNVGH